MDTPTDTLAADAAALAALQAKVAAETPLPAMPAGAKRVKPYRLAPSNQTCCFEANGIGYGATGIPIGPLAPATDA